MNFSECDDIVAIAAQLGRLDFVSSLLAGIGVVLVLGGIFAFINFRGLAKTQAKKEAEKVSKEIAEKVANSYLQEELPKIYKEYMDLFEQNRDFDNKADSIIPRDDGGSEQ